MAPSLLSKGTGAGTGMAWGQQNPAPLTDQTHQQAFAALSMGGAGCGAHSSHWALISNPITKRSL